MPPASNPPTGAAPIPVDQMSPIQLKSLRQDPQKLTVYHQTSADGLDRHVILEAVPASMLSAFSPYCKALLVNANKKSITITGGSASAVKAIIKYMNQYCDDKRSIPTLPSGSQLLAYFQLHEAAGVMQVGTVTGWARVEAELLLEYPVFPDDVTTVLSKYQTGRYQAMLRYNLAYCMSAWLGGYSENCNFVKDLEGTHADFVVQLRLTCEAFNVERRDAWTRKFKALCAEDDRVCAEEERKHRIQQKRKNHSQMKQQRYTAVTALAVAPVRKVTPSPFGSYAAVAAAPVQISRARAATASAPAPKPTNQSASRARTPTVGHAGPSAVKAVPTRAVAAHGNSWVSIARQGAQSAAQ